jgi:VWFA-related protein
MRNDRFRTRSLAALVLTLTTGLSARQQTPPTFRSGVSLVTVDVSVLDKDGKPVPGLQFGDFEIKLNGKVRPVKVATFIEAAAELGPAAAAIVPKAPEPAAGAREGTQVSSNEGVIAAQKQRGEDRVFVLLIDDLSFAPMRGRSLFQAARTFINNLPASDVVGLAMTSGAAAINPTTDRTKVRSALDRAAGEATDFQSLTPTGAGVAPDPDADSDGSVGVSQALEISQGNNEVLKVAIANACFQGERDAVDRAVLEILIAQNNCAAGVNKQWKTIAAQTRQTTRRQVDAYVSVIDAMKAASGLRHLVVLSDGVAIGRDATQLFPAAKAAAAAGVQVSVLMEERDLNLADAPRRQSGGGNLDPGAPQRRVEDNKMFLAGAQQFAEMAGGQFYRIIGQPAPFFDRVRAASSAVYRLGIEPGPETDTSRIDSVEAKVKRSGVTVRANRHGVAESSAVVAAGFAPSIDEKLKAAIGQAQAHGAVPLRVATALRRSDRAGTLDLNINAEVPASMKGPLVAMFGLVKEGGGLGNITTGRREIVAPPGGGPFVLSVVMPVDAGSYRLRLAVADATSALGTLDVPVEAALAKVGPLVASDLITAWVDAKGQPHVFALEDLPPAATGAQTILELYAPPGGAAGMLEAIKDDVQVEITMTRDGVGDPVEERSIVPRLVGGLLRASVEFPIADLSAGTYRLRARVEVGGKAAGSVVATIRKR